MMATRDASETRFRSIVRELGSFPLVWAGKREHCARLFSKIRQKCWLNHSGHSNKSVPVSSSRKRTKCQLVKKESEFEFNLESDANEENAVKKLRSMDWKESFMRILYQPLTAGTRSGPPVTSAYSSVQMSFSKFQKLSLTFFLSLWRNEEGGLCGWAFQ